MALDIATEAGRWLFVGFFIAFAIKAPLFPVHTWLADTTEQATPGTSVLLVCVLDKIGTFGMLRFCLGIFPEASQWATPVVVTIAVISIIYGALVAIGQDDVLRLIGLTSLSHFGFITLGIFVFSSQGGSGAILYMVNHGIGTAALFLVAGYLIKRRGTALISEMGGVEKVTPVLAGLMLVAGLATLGLPGPQPVRLRVPGAAGGLRLRLVGRRLRRHRHRARRHLRAVDVPADHDRAHAGPRSRPPPTARGARSLAVAPLMLALVFFGFFPKPLLETSNPYVADLMQHVGVTDDEPTVAAETTLAEEAGR